MIKTGIVTQVNKNIVYLMTSSGEFVKVKAKGTTPSIGEIFSGQVYVERKILRLPALAAAMLSFILLGSGFYTYYTPVAAITIDINPSVELQVNRWNRIIKASPLNDDGKTILSNINLTNKSPEEGLQIIVDQAEKNNFINEEYKNSDKVISVHVVEKKHDQIDLSAFQAAVEKQNLKVSIKEDTNIKKESTKENINQSDINKASSNNDNPSDAQNNKTDESNNNKVQDKKEDKIKKDNDKLEDNAEDKAKNSGDKNSKENEKNKNDASDKNELKSDKEDKKEDKKESKNEDKKENKNTKSTNNNATGSGFKNEKGKNKSDK